jgi:Cu(I)/Ag(I) efflux system membrane fusion protein
MPLEPARSDSANGSSAAEGLPPGAVHVSAERQQLVGVRLGVAERVSGRRTLRTTGRVAPDENATYPLVAGVSGWIRDVGSATTGTHVRKNEVLASLYAPDFVVAQQSYYSGLETFDRSSNQQIQSFNQARVIEGVRRFADTLRNLGVSEPQLATMSKNREMVQDIHVMSPVDGFVLVRNISKGLRFDRGFELYRIADLEHVWILADVYQHQLPFVQRGLHARITTTQENRSYDARVSRTEPIFDEETLTLKVRLETANPGLVLKPGMFVDVEFPIELPEALVVPADAIVDSGARKTVFVDRGNGYFEPRQVETGWRIAGDVEVTKGLMASERIVISGTFLIDSESRMRAAAHGILGDAAEDPVCGMQVDEKRAAAAGRSLQHGGRTYYFCSDDCRHQFDKQPSRYVTEEGAAPRLSPASPATHDHAPSMRAPDTSTPDPDMQTPDRHTSPPAPDVPSPAPHVPAPEAAAVSPKDASAVDPMCGMTVNVADAVAKGRTSERQGATHYFCSDHCKKQFDTRP